MLKALAPQIKTLTKGARDLHKRATESSQWLVSFAPAPVLDDAIPFQDPIDEICAEHPPRFMRSTHYVIVGLFLTVLLVASLVRVDIVVVGTGRLITAVPPIMLQPFDRAIIRELKVKAGDTVKKGEVLATLDPTFARADLAAVSGQEHSLQAEVRRLDAELNNATFDPGPSPGPDELLQQSLFSQRQAEFASQLKVFDEEIAQRRAAIGTTEIDRASQEKQLALAREVEKMRESMLEKQIGSRLNFVEAQASRVRIEQAYDDAGNRLTELRHDLQSKEAERQSFMDQWRQKTLEALVAARNDAARVGGSLSKATLANDLVVVTAPDDGVVLDVAKRSVGSILHEAEPLITIVPSNAELIGEVMINSADIGHTKTGDQVVVKVDAFPYQIHGFLKGRLLSVSQESFSPTGGEGGVLPEPTRQGSGAFHRGLVKLEQTKLDDMPDGARLIPGMTMSAEIKVGSRSVMSYFLSPITRGLSESIREP